MANLKQVPTNLKEIQPYIKIAEEHEKRDPCITYWCRLYAVQSGLKLNDKTPESSSYLITLMDYLENIKKTKHDDEAITNEVVAQAHIENYALKLFVFADGEDRAGRFNKNVVKAFYTAGFIYDIVNVFGEVTEEVVEKTKYAKFKSAYIHNCLKDGITPVPGPMAMEGERDDLNDPEPRMGLGPGYPPSTSQAPYPIGGLFSIPSERPEGMNLPAPGAYAPPSTPNGASHLPPTTSDANIDDQQHNQDTATLNPDIYVKAQKYCKFAGSALTYEDAPTAIDNLQKALSLLTTGQDV